MRTIPADPSGRFYLVWERNEQNHVRQLPRVVHAIVAPPALYNHDVVLSTGKVIRLWFTEKTGACLGYQDAEWQWLVP